MQLITVLALTLVALALLWSTSRGYITDDTLQRFANVAGVVSLLAALVVFVIPSQSLPINNSSAAPEPTVDNAVLTATPESTTITTTSAYPGALLHPGVRISVSTYIRSSKGAMKLPVRHSLEDLWRAIEQDTFVIEAKSDTLAAAGTEVRLDLSVQSLSDLEWVRIEPFLLMRLDEYSRDSEPIDAVSIAHTGGGGATGGGGKGREFKASLPPVAPTQTGVIKAPLTEKEFDYLSLQPGEFEVLYLAFTPPVPGTYKFSFGLVYDYAGETHEIWFPRQYALNVPAAYREYVVSSDYSWITAEECSYSWLHETYDCAARRSTHNEQGTPVTIELSSTPTPLSTLPPMPSPTITPSPTPPVGMEPSGVWLASWWCHEGATTGTLDLNPYGFFTFEGPPLIYESMMDSYVSFGGTWSFEGDQITLEENELYQVLFIGTYNENTITGQYGSDGCWQAVRKTE